MSLKHLSAASYRSEVDGLRAAAILPVVLFHADVPGFSGGYVGVDVFFVISGYLITRIILEEARQSRFSFREFYERRVRRIFPALFAVEIFCLLLGFATLSPVDLTSLGKNTVAATLFASNIFFWHQGLTSGYFGDSSQFQLLLHTWSLSVEEQFYLIFPGLILLLTRFGGSWLRIGLWTAAAVSLAVNLWSTAHHPQSAFYLPVPRAWEFLTGSLLAAGAVPVLHRNILREGIGLAGLALILAPVLIYTEDTQFPGLAAVAPCLGTAFVLHGTSDGPSFTRSLLSTRPLVFIGSISYSLYLWHWPLLVFARKLILGKQVSGVTLLDAGTTVGVLAVSLVAAVLSYRFIEAPFRGRRSRVGSRQVLAFAVATTAVPLLCGFTLYHTGGLPARFPATVQRLIAANTQRKDDWQDSCSNFKRPIHSINDINFCVLGPEATGKMMFIGDSHVQQLYPVVSRMFEDGDLGTHGVVFAINEGCKPTEHMNNVPSSGYYCDTFTRFALQRAFQADIDTVYIGFVINGSWDLCPSADSQCTGRISDEEAYARFLAELTDHVRALRTAGKRVIVSLPFPLYNESIPDLLIRNDIMQRYGLIHAATERSSQSVREKIASSVVSAGGELFDPRQSLCGQGQCITSLDGVSIYKDHNHLAASQIGILRPALESLLRYRM